MKHIRLINEQGIFIEDAFVDELTEFTILEPITIYAVSGVTPKWDGEQWVQVVEPPIVEEVIPEPTDVEILRQDVDELQETVLHDIPQPMMFRSMMVAVRKILKQSDMTDEELLELIDVYDEFELGLEVIIGDYYKYQDNLYEVIQAHTTQWTPDTVPALFNKVIPKGVIPEWVQPTGGHDAYKIGDTVTFNGKTYESVINSNTWSPTDYPAGWKVL